MFQAVLTYSNLNTRWTWKCFKNLLHINLRILFPSDEKASPTHFCLSFSDFPTHLSGNKEWLADSVSGFEQTSVDELWKQLTNCSNFFFWLPWEQGMHAHFPLAIHNLTYVLYIRRDTRGGHEGGCVRFVEREIMWETDKALLEEPWKYTWLFYQDAACHCTSPKQPSSKHNRQLEAPMEAEEEQPI